MEDGFASKPALKQNTGYMVEKTYDGVWNLPCIPVHYCWHPVYGEIRNQFGALDNDDDLVKFFNSVLEKRDQIDEQQKDQKKQKK